MRSAPGLAHVFARVNILAAAAVWVRSGGKIKPLPGIPSQAQAALAGLYTCVGLGLKRIPRLGPDRFPDRFLEYLSPQRVHLV